MKPRERILAITAVLLAFTVPSTAENKSSGKTETGWGLHTATFETPKGKISVYLPDDMAAGDTISGTVTEEPIGTTEKEKRRNSGELNGYVVELDRQQMPVKAGMVKWTIGPVSQPVQLILRDKRGAEIAATSVPVLSTPPSLQTVAAGGANSFRFPSLTQAGRPIEIQGPFDGDLSNTSLKVEGTALTPLAESPRKLLAESPREVVGPTEITLVENKTSTPGTIRNVGIGLSAPRTNLMRGEKTELTVQVHGLEGIRAPISIRLQNKSPQTVQLNGGDTQTIEVHPNDVQTGGIYTWNGTLTGVQSGGFAVVASIPPSGDSGP